MVPFKRVSLALGIVLVALVAAILGAGIAPKAALAQWVGLQSVAGCAAVGPTATPVQNSAGKPISGHIVAVFQVSQNVGCPSGAVPVLVLTVV